MKFKNVKVGDQVKVKVDQVNEYRFDQRHEGTLGTVVQIDLVDKDRYPVQVEFGDGSCDWGSHKGLKLVKDGSTSNE